MSVSALPLADVSGTVRLVDTAVSRPALISHIRPAVVLSEADTRRLMDAADQNGVHHGGLFLAGPVGIQLWSKPFDGPNGTAGSSEHVGTVDWTYNSPIKHYATIYRSIVTSSGILAGETTASILARVLALCGINADDRVTMPIPPPRDPFRRH
jgi:hypothetical protein